EVPRIAQMFGMDTSTRGNIGSVVHTTSSVFTLVRQFAH
ncbi:MAG: conjugal transfer protein TrbL family protein, partial [Acutalibacteraceae bacterium]